MDPTPDELAGVVDLFGALTRAELRRGLAELAYKRGGAHDPDRFADDVESALRSYHVVAVDAVGADAGAPVVVVGPVAFPALPEGAEDLPHILDTPLRDPDQDAVAAAAVDRFRQDAATAIDTGDHSRVESLLDVSYELEAWAGAGVDLSATRSRMDDELDR
jgi:hypothetical protein